MTTSPNPASSAPANRGGLVVATIMTLVALPILIGLGFWQLERLAWKESLLAAIAERTKGEPADVLGVYSATHESDLGYEYYRVKVRGRFLHDKERYFYAPDQTRGPGYHVYTPFEIADGEGVLFVNRGYVTEAKKDPASRQEGQISGDVEVVGLLRSPGTKATFTPENDIKGNLWYWRDYYGMLGSVFGSAPRTGIPVFIDAEAAAPGGWPMGGATLIEFPNRHLEYALTWFGLAGALLAVFAAFVWTRLRATPPETA
jgi:surfeit locus 1 family protein